MPLNKTERKNRRLLDELSESNKSLKTIEESEDAQILDPNGDPVSSTQTGYLNDVSNNVPLNAFTSFDSGIIDIGSYTQIINEIFSDQAGTFRGIWYADLAGNTELRRFEIPYDPSTNLLLTSSPIFSRYLRIQYINGSSTQTAFHLRTKISNESVSGQFLQIDGFIPNNVLAELTRSVIVGKDSDNNFRNVLVNAGQALITGDFESEVALGNIPNYEIETKFGRNPDVDTESTPEDIWNGGGNYTGHPINYTPNILEILSNNANDTAAGTGARTIRIFGLRSPASEEYESEDITLNGLTPVNTVNTWWRVNRVVVLTAGSNEENLGTIEVRDSVDSAIVFARVPLYNQSTIAAYTVPANRIFLLKRVRVSITRANGSAGSATITLRVRESESGVFRAIRVFELQTGAVTEFTQLGGDIIPPGTDIKFRIQSVSDAKTICEGAFEYLLVTQNI